MATNRTPFSDRKCRRAIAEFVSLLNDAPSLTLEDVSQRLDDMGVSIEEDWVDEALDERRLSLTNGDQQYAFAREFRMSYGMLDPRPIELEDINLIRRVGNRATYQFTLRRYSYHAADLEGCNGLFAHDEYYGHERSSCLATLYANRLNTVRRFPEWYLEE